MKNVKVFISVIALTLFVTTAAMANSKTKITNKAKLGTELAILLGDYNFTIDEKSITADVSFMVNENSEVVVLSVNSKRESVDFYVKGRLNYKKVDATGITKGKIYIMPLKIENPN